MRERPILFSGPMVRALLAGTKTQTRRPVKPAPPANTVAMGRWQDPGPEPAYWAFLRDGPVEHDHPFGGAELHGEPWRCPYGQPGDRLWVREAWRAPAEFDRVKPSDLRAPSGGLLGTPIVYEATRHESVQFGKLRPGMFMPRWASRILLEVTDVRVERLQDISEVDAQAEGLLALSSGADLTWTVDAAAASEHVTARETYAWLWDEINGPGSWDANPWVWVVGFRRLA